MSTPCPACGGTHLLAVAEHYATQVRRTDADPEALAPLAPPLRRSVLWGTASATLFFLTVLAPGFVPSERSLTALIAFLLVALLTFALWLRTRRTDRHAMAAYQKRRICQDCGWHE